MIREWLLPGWLMAVQAFVTLALILSFASQILLACVIVRWPLRTVLRYEWVFVCCSFVMVALASKFFLSICLDIYHEIMMLVGRSFQRVLPCEPTVNFLYTKFLN